MSERKGGYRAVGIFSDKIGINCSCRRYTLRGRTDHRCRKVSEVASRPHSGDIRLASRIGANELAESERMVDWREPE